MEHPVSKIGVLLAYWKYSAYLAGKLKSLQIFWNKIQFFFHFISTCTFVLLFSPFFPSNHFSLLEVGSKTLQWNGLIVGRLNGLLIGRSVCHNFLKGRELGALCIFKHELVSLFSCFCVRIMYFYLIYLQNNRKARDEDRQRERERERERKKERDKLRKKERDG